MAAGIAAADTQSVTGSASITGICKFNSGQSPVLAFGAIDPLGRLVQDRFQKERRLEPADFQDALARFQRDAHEVVTLLHRQFTDLQSDENRQVIGKLVEHTHNLVDLVVGSVNMGADLGNQLIRKAQSQKPSERAQQSR